MALFTNYKGCLPSVKAATRDARNGRGLMLGKATPTSLSNLFFSCRRAMMSKTSYRDVILMLDTSL